MTSSYWTRRIARNLGILAVAAAVYFIVIEAASSSRSVMYRLSMATGYASVALIAWAMLIGPWRVRRGRTAPVSTDLRRDAGIWGGLFGLAHVITGLQVHMGGHFMKYFLTLEGTRAKSVRFDLFGLSNWTGLGAAVLLIMLLVISNDVSLRALGSARWKAWQRWTYPAAVLIVAHTLGYYVIEKTHTWYLIAFVAVTIVVLWLQLAGRRRVLARATGSPSS
jgi:sulfoxide reductase heme-binding subunit YedZ